jgi:pantoate--beta-alanine ligase
VRVEEGALSQGLCGRDRPGHFPGVCLIVVKLFWIAQPDIAVFGEKDFQQLAVIRRLVRDLNVPIRIDGVATVRDADGLALSSRNAYLSPGQRKTAPSIYRALASAKSLFASQHGVTSEEITRHAAEILENLPEASLDYLELVDAESLAPLTGSISRPAVLAAAVRLGTTRLIDHVDLTPHERV